MTLCRESSAELATLLDLTPELAKLRPVMAAERLREKLYEISTTFPRATPTWRCATKPAPEGPDLDKMTAVELATLRADLQAEALELKRRLRQGELLAENKVTEDIQNRLLPARSRLLGLPTAVGAWFELGEAEGKKRLRQDLVDSLSRTRRVRCGAGRLPAAEPAGGAEPWLASCPMVLAAALVAPCPTAAPTPALDLRLPALPHDAQERAEAVATLAAALVGEYGAVIALALAAAVDEAAAEVADDAAR